MTEDRKQLETLRVSLARLAQAAELHHMIPGAPGQGAPFEVLTVCAKIDEGWNTLVAALLAKHLADWLNRKDCKMSFAAEVKADHTGTWAGNAVRFATREEAESYVSDLMMRWTAVRETRVVESTDPVKHKWVNGKTEAAD